MNLTDTFQAVWCDERLAGRSFSVDIARLDKPEVREYYDSLTQEERDELDDEIFFFVYDDSEWDYLYDANAGNDFYLLKDE